MSTRLFVSAMALIATLLTFGGPAKAGSPIADKYRETAKRIIDSTMADNDAWDKMEVLCLEIGHRLSGSTALRRAIDWAEQAMFVDKLERIRTEPVDVPRWTRGKEYAALTKPRAVQLNMLGLGGSVGTEPSGITADVVVVANEEELEELGDGAKGKIVLFNNVMPPYNAKDGASYGRAVRFRSNGAKLAAEKGAVACLIRSVTATSLHTPHTGAMHYDESVKKIPAAAISIEDAELIAGLARRGLPVAVRLKMSARDLVPQKSANVIGEWRGSTNPEEYVVIGGHIDSWDVGQGAHDNAGGCVIAMEALNVLRKLGLRARRTIRVVLWTNEENGLAGAKKYAEYHAHELPNHIAAIEADSGAFAPTGYSLECKNEGKAAIALEQIKQITDLIGSIGTLGTLESKMGHGGADISPMKDAGVVLMGHRTEGSKYFDYHHSHADTLDKVDPVELSQNVAALAVMAYIIADMPERLGERSK